MTAKYTDGQIIAYLKTLREGDVLTAVKTDDDGNYTAGRRYVVSKVGGDLRVADNDGYKFSVNQGGYYKSGIFEYIREGIFEIPSQANAVKPFHIDITSYTIETQCSAHEIEIVADAAGLARLFELEAEGKKSRDLDHLYARRDAIQADIDALEAQ